mmetsp:Transcript_49943/g.139880  ORF Transcript_49943/g.139880 Transcript_49943/m.139880 type:complete len:242 (+) Transcript_49943:2170-2895(+)
MPKPRLLASNHNCRRSRPLRFSKAREGPTRRACGCHRTSKLAVGKRQVLVAALPPLPQVAVEVPQVAPAAWAAHRRKRNRGPATYNSFWLPRSATSRSSRKRRNCVGSSCAMSGNSGARSARVCWLISGAATRQRLCCGAKTPRSKSALTACSSERRSRSKSDARPACRRRRRLRKARRSTCRSVRTSWSPRYTRRVWSSRGFGAKCNNLNASGRKLAHGFSRGSRSPRHLATMLRNRGTS